MRDPNFYSETVGWVNQRPLFHTAQALAIYDATEPHRDAKREAYLNASDRGGPFVEADYFGPGERAWEAVQHAFWNDTRDCNHRDHAALVSEHYIRKQVCQVPLP